MAVVYVSPAGSGDKSGSSPDNAMAVGSLNSAINKAGAGGTVLMLADQGDYNLTAALSITNGGSDGAPVTIMGVDSFGNEMDVQINGTRPADYSPTNPAGNACFRLLSGADFLVFENMSFANVGTAFRVGADISGLVIQDMYADNVRRFLEDYVSGTNTTATISGLTVRNVDVHGFSAGVIRLQYDTNDVLIENVFGDSERQDGDGIAMGIHLDGTVHDVVIRNTTMENAQSSSGGYWNGDGFATERGVYDVTFEGTIARGNADGGYDLKSANTVLIDAIAEDNGRNFRLWGDTTLINPTGIDPHKWGGSVGAQIQIQIMDGADVKVVGGNFVDSGSSTVVVAEDGNGTVVFDGTKFVYAEGARFQIGEAISGIDPALVKAVLASGRYSTNGESLLPQSGAPFPDQIENALKIGIGTYQIADPASMFADIDQTNANWFYTWKPFLPEAAVTGWSVGEAVETGGTSNDADLFIGAGTGGWAWQSVDVDAGQTYALSFTADALAGATGGIVLEFTNASGTVLSRAYLPVTDSIDSYHASVTAPANAVQANLIAYATSGGGFTLDDVSIASAGTQILVNGAFELCLHPTEYQGAFVPMIWGAADMVYARTPGFFGSEDTLLTFNEPDNRDQANLTVSQALSYWSDLMATGMRLGSPATTMGQTLGEGSWLQSFMDQADARGYRVDFIAVHYYSTNTSVDAFKAFLEQVHETYQRPVWVTEWALADWANQGRFTAEQQEAFFEAATQMLDDLPFVERHSWFGMYDGLDNWDINTGLVDGEGQLSVVGSTFARLAEILATTPPPPPADTAPTDCRLSHSTVKENAEAATSIGFVSAVDANSADSFSYQLTDNAGGRFAINQTTGELLVLDGTLLDFETLPAHQIVVRVTDALGHEFEKPITIQILDGADPRSLGGTAHADAIAPASADHWTIDALAGDDVITTLGGSDTVRGGAGDDTISVGAGDDVISFSGSGDGFDSVAAGEGDDRIIALAANSVIGLKSVSGVEFISANGMANVRIAGSVLADTLDFSQTSLENIVSIMGGAGADRIIGSAGNDLLIGGVGNDSLDGGGGDDTFGFAAADGVDAVDGGSGHDRITATAANARIALLSIAGIEEISGGDYSGVWIIAASEGVSLDFSAVALSGIERISGGTGNDTIVGSAGNDLISGGAGGGDALYGGGGDDTFLFGNTSGSDIIDGGLGNDVLRATGNGAILNWNSTTQVETISANGFASVDIIGTGFDDVIDLSAVRLEGIRRIAGGNGNDEITGGSGADVLVGGLGADRLKGNAGADTFVFASSAESRASSGIDAIADFERASDRIDLTGIDASTKLAGNQAFTFIGGGAFTKAAGQLRVDTSDPTRLMVLGDVNGDGVADFQVMLEDLQQLGASDFLL